jgi:hypothetical protein
MTLTQLYQRIQYLMAQGHGHRLVTMSKDPEGNGFQTLKDVELSRFNRMTQEQSIDELTPELQSQGWNEEDVLEGDDVVPSVTLWP